MSVNIISAFKYASQILHIELKNITNKIIIKKLTPLLNQDEESIELIYLIPILFIFFMSSSFYISLVNIIKIIIYELIKISLINEPKIRGNTSLGSSNISLNNYALNTDNLFTITSTPLPNGSILNNEETNTPMKIFIQYMKNLTINKEKKINLFKENTNLTLNELKIKSAIHEISIENLQEQLSFDENCFVDEISGLNNKTEINITLENELINSKKNQSPQQNLSLIKIETRSISKLIQQVDIDNKKNIILSPKTMTSNAYILTYLTKLF